jgi:hypothetical protein
LERSKNDPVLPVHPRWPVENPDLSGNSVPSRQRRASPSDKVAAVGAWSLAIAQVLRVPAATYSQFGIQYVLKKFFRRPTMQYWHAADPVPGRKIMLSGAFRTLDGWSREGRARQWPPGPLRENE